MVQRPPQTLDAVFAALDGELRVGGCYRIAMEQPDGERRVLVWTFREIARPVRLVYRWRWEDGPEAGEESLVTVMFRDAKQRTEIEVIHTGIADRAVRDSHGAGWLGCLDELVTTLNQMVSCCAMRSVHRAARPRWACGPIPVGSAHR